MKRKALIEVLTDGTLLNISYKEHYSDTSDFAQRVRPWQLMRLGPFSITVGRLDLSISAPDEYREPMETVPRNSQYWGRSCKDRLDQLHRIETALAQFPGHPFEGLARYEIALERTYLRTSLATH